MNHSQIHFEAKKAADTHRKSEMELLNALGLVWKNKTFSQYGCRSLFEYSTKELKLSEEMASIVNKIAKVQPEKAIPERARYQKAGDTLRVAISYSMTQEEFAMFERTQDLLSQKLKRPASISEVHLAALEELQQKLDPLKKPIHQKSAGTTKLTITLKRKLHQVHNSQCTFKDADGIRCTERRHLDIHHIIPRSQGGTNIEQNLTLLCSGHHRAHHRAEKTG